MLIGKSFSSIAPPGLTAELELVFRLLCTPLASTECLTLKSAVLAHVEAIRSALQQNEFLDVNCAEKIAEVLLFLLELITEFDEQQQRLIAGAAKYFVNSQDAEPDITSLLGFEDDVEVLNYVLEQIGQPELKVIL